MSMYGKLENIPSSDNEPEPGINWGAGFGLWDGVIDHCVCDVC